MFGTYLIRYLPKLCPRSFVLPALIMLGGKAQPVVEVRIIENDVAMQVVFIIVDGDNILIITLELTVTQLLSDLHSLFGRNFTGGKALYQMVCKDFCPSCSCVPDCSEVLACSCAVGSASIRADIYTVDGLISVCDVSDRCADCCPDRMDRSVCQISLTPLFISVISSA